MSDVDYCMGGAYMVLNYRDTVNFIANCRCAIDDFHDIQNFHLRDVYEMPNTEQKLPRLPYHRLEIVK